MKEIVQYRGPSFCHEMLTTCSQNRSLITYHRYFFTLNTSPNPALVAVLNEGSSSKLSQRDSLDGGGCLQGEDLVPVGREGFVLRLGLQPGVDELENTEGVALASEISSCQPLRLVYLDRQVADVPYVLE